MDEWNISSDFPQICPQTNRTDFPILLPLPTPLQTIQQKSRFLSTIVDKVNILYTIVNNCPHKELGDVL